MRISLRFIVPLILALGLVAYGLVPLIDRLTLHWFERDLDIRADLISNAIREPLTLWLASQAPAKVTAFLSNITLDERLFALAYCAGPEGPMIATASLPSEIHCNDLSRWREQSRPILENTHGLLHLAVKSMATASAPAAQLVIVHDMSFVGRRSAETRQYVFYVFLGVTLLVSLITVVIAQLSWRGWVAGMRAILRGEGLVRRPQASLAAVPPAPEFQPIARDLQRLLRELESSYRSRDESQITWTPEALRAILRGELRGDDVILVSNREPYIHLRREGQVEVHRPASGLVTAMEPVMRACSGVWIAHGSGSADRETVDARDQVAVPPDDPVYCLRRIWLTPEQETGYYYGFSNEGLWPLCHIAHVRPTFRSEDWAYYVEVNRIFADAVVATAKTPDPIVLIQDYHFALAPRMIRERLPEATIITFWHIPWPNPESFAICPWGPEIMDGLLGSSILGFHTMFHCNNFVDTVDRCLEARVDRESHTVSFGGKLTAVRRYPISIEWPPLHAGLARPLETCRPLLRTQNGLPADCLLGVGVDRLDYTKGIVERFRAIERLLELRPEWIGRFSFIQIAAPTRSRIGEYQDHQARVEALAQQINARFAQGGMPPIILKAEQHQPVQVYEYYRAADFCFVSSLHDGMNLVAKEYVAAHDDELGVLILSQFTGAARELPEALIVNPYDADQCAAALHLAMTMPVAEQRDRMKLMRALVMEFNVYRWAGRMLLDAALMRRRGRLLTPAAPAK